jgi:hypothetical protein
VRGLTKAVIENSYYENVRNPDFVEAGELVQRGNVTVNSTWDSGKVRSKGSAFNPGKLLLVHAAPGGRRAEPAAHLLRTAGRHRRLT